MSVPTIISRFQPLKTFFLQVLADVRREEWEKFDGHARHVQILLLSQTQPQVSPFVYDRLQKLRKDPLLPALRELRIPACYVGDLRSSFMSLSPQLRLVELHSDSIEFFLSFTPALVEEAPLLTHLILHTQVNVNLERVSDLKQLCKLDLQVPTWNLSELFIRKLGELERLSDLHVELNNELGNRLRNKKPTRHILGTTNDGYQKLQTLLIRGSAIAITQMMRAMSFASLLTLTLEFNTTDSWQEVLKTLVEKETHITTVSLHSYSVTIDCKFGWISPLLQIQTLETLEIDIQSSFIDNDEFFSLMSSLPNLKILSLPPLSPLTAQVLWQPSKLAPGLAELKVSLFQSATPPSGMMEIKIPRRHAHLALRKLSIGSLYGNMQDGDVIHFARLLYRAFPNLEIVEGFGPNTHDVDSWGRVDTFRMATEPGQPTFGER